MMPYRLTWLLIISMAISGAVLPGLEYIEQEWLFAPVSQIPILMYHVIGEDNSSWQELYVKPTDFRAQMNYLAEEGYNPITLKQLYANWEQGLPLPPKPIVITFDDGYSCVYEEAYRAMHPYNFKGVIFTYVNKFQYENSMSEEEVKLLLEAGWELGSHTYSHKDLTTLSAPQLEQEIVQSRVELEEMFGVTITSLCYPSGQYNVAVLEEAEQAGYLLGVTTHYGFAQKEQGLLTLNRVRINRSDGLQGFINKLSSYESE